MENNVTSTQARAAFEITKAVAQTIRDLKQVPSGVLYAKLMAHLTIDQYQQIIDTLKRAELVTETNNLLQWNEAHLNAQQPADPSKS